MAGRKKAKKADESASAKPGDAKARSAGDASAKAGDASAKAGGTSAKAGDVKAQSPAQGDAPSRRALLLGAVAIFALHAFACMWARNLGFDHISDDDFSRVTIAQAWAHSAKLDPSGTSWLPFPFWILGLGMKILGRELTTAQGLSIFFASAAAPLPWVALRLGRVPGWRAFLGVVFALGTPWAIWTGAATVPESFTASLTAAGLIGLATNASPRANIAFGAALFAACLSRYEPWPAAAVAALALGLRLARERATLERPARVGLSVALALCIAGPLLWMAWNAHAHDGPFHFFRRVSTYKQAIGAGATSTFEALVFYPKLLLAIRPEVTFVALLFSPLAMADKEVRRQWGLPLLGVLAEVVFLAIGNARDGAPAHHSERALLACFEVLALFVAWVLLTPWIKYMKDDDTASAQENQVRRQRTPKAQRAFLGFVIVAWLITIVRGADAPMPGTQHSEQRESQLQQGDKLRRDGAKSLEITPCGYEHFALIAAYGAPENVTINPSHFSPDACPKVDVK